MTRKAISYGAFSALGIERREAGVLLVTMNRPQQLNAWSDELLNEFAALWPIVAADDATRVVVVTGAGKAFSVGGDIELVSSFPDDLARSEACARRYSAVLQGLLELQKPVVAAINGDVLGGALGMALMCDVILVDSEARLFCASQLNINVFPAPEAFLWRMRGVPGAKARYHLLRSDTLSAEQAERIGLVSGISEPGAALEDAMAYACEVAARDPVAISWTRHALNHAMRTEAPLLDAWLSMEAHSFGLDPVKPALERLRQQLGTE